MKRILTALLTGVVAAAACVSGAAASENAMKCRAVCDFSKEQIEISGTVETETVTNGFVTVQVLKNGVAFEGLNEKTIEEKEAGILYTGQKRPDADGNFAFTVGYSKEDMPQDAAKALPFAIRVAASQGAGAVNLTVELVSKELYAATVEKINAVASDSAKTDEEFAAALKEELPQLGVNCAPLAETDLSGSAIKAYRAQVAGNALNAEKMPENSKIFQNFMLMEAVKKNQSFDLESYAEQIYETENGLKDAYKSVAKNDTIQAYFTQKFADALKNSDEIKNGANVTLDTFTKAWKVAVILTNARYGDGFGNLKSSLIAYGSEIGITQVKPDSVYRNLLGKDYTAKSLKEAFDGAKEEAPSGGGGGNRGSGGSGSSSNKLISGELTMDAIGRQNTSPIRKNFIDIDSVEWASEAILALADKGIVNGKEEQVFKPNDPVTREEFVKILVGAMNLGDASYVNHFEDVADSDWFCPWVNIAYEKEICKGIGNGYFGVGSQLTRQDMVVLLNNALKLKGIQLPDADTIAFEDKDSIADYASVAVSNMVSIGAVNGVSDTAFEPMGEATRAQAATIIYRVLDKLQ